MDSCEHSKNYIYSNLIFWMLNIKNVNYADGLAVFTLLKNAKLHNHLCYFTQFPGNKLPLLVKLPLKVPVPL